VALLVGAGVVVGALVAFSGGNKKLHGRITFAVLAPSSGAGKLGARARDLVDGANMAAGAINRKGGLLGRRLVLTVEDDGCAPLIAYEAAKSLVDGGGATGVIGGICNRPTAREIAVIDSSGIPFLVTSANGAGLVTPETTSAYLMNGTIHQQAMSAVYWMNYKSAQRLAVVADSSPDSRALAEQAIRLVDQAPQVVSFQIVPVGRRDLRQAAAAVVASSPDFVYWTGSPASGGALLRALRGLGFRGIFTGSAVSESPEFVQAAGPAAAEGAFVTATAAPRNLPNAEVWRAQFRSAYHREPGLDAMQAYDAVGALAQAIRQAGATESAKVKANLTRLSEHFTTFLGVMRFAGDHTLLYDNRVILVVRKGAFAWKRSLRTDTLQ
jgi:branched-chain amino acid transport system substrate-binding protein